MYSLSPNLAVAGSMFPLIPLRYLRINERLPLRTSRDFLTPK